MWSGLPAGLRAEAPVVEQAVEVAADEPAERLVAVEQLAAGPLAVIVVELAAVELVVAELVVIAVELVVVEPVAVELSVAEQAVSPVPVPVLLVAGPAAVELPAAAPVVAVEGTFASQPRVDRSLRPTHLGGQWPLELGPVQWPPGEGLRFRVDTVQTAHGGTGTSKRGPARRPGLE